MGTKRDNLRDFYGDNPWLDWLVLVLVGVVWWVPAHGWFPTEASTRSTFYTATGSLAGIVLAAATFACTQVFQAMTGALPRAREENEPEYRRGAVGLLGSLLVAAVLPLGAVVLDQPFPQWGFGLGILAAALVVVRFLRVLAWVDLGLRGAAGPAHTAPRRARRSPRLRSNV